MPSFPEAEESTPLTGFVPVIPGSAEMHQTVNVLTQVLSFGRASYKIAAMYWHKAFIRLNGIAHCYREAKLAKESFKQYNEGLGKGARSESLDASSSALPLDCLPS